MDPFFFAYIRGIHPSSEKWKHSDMDPFTELCLTRPLTVEVVGRIRDPSSIETRSTKTQHLYLVKFAWFTLPWLLITSSYMGDRIILLYKSVDLRVEIFMTVSPIALAMVTVEANPFTVLTESYCTSIRVILLWILKFAGTVWIRLFLACLSSFSLRKSC